MLSEVFAPWVIVIVLSGTVAWEATHALPAAAAWGLLVALTSSVIPMGVIVWGARRGRWDGHHVRNREGRLVPLSTLIALSGLGLALLLVLDAPWLVVALDIAMLVCLVVTSAITVWWKVSMHAAVAAGADVHAVAVVVAARGGGGGMVPSALAGPHHRAGGGGIGARTRRWWRGLRVRVVSAIVSRCTHGDHR